MVYDVSMIPESNQKAFIEAGYTMQSNAFVKVEDSVSFVATFRNQNPAFFEIRIDGDEKGFAAILASNSVTANAIYDAEVTAHSMP